jgi:Flp pilus assembly protein TadD
MIKSHIFWLKDDLANALEEMHKAVELNPKEPRFYHFRGM